jgi:hypothetical protein
MLLNYHRVKKVYEFNGEHTPEKPQQRNSFQQESRHAASRIEIAFAVAVTDKYAFHPVDVEKQIKSASPCLLSFIFSCADLIQIALNRVMQLNRRDMIIRKLISRRLPTHDIRINAFAAFHSVPPVGK